MLKKAIPVSLVTLLAAAGATPALAADMSAAEVLQKSNEAMSSLDSYSSKTMMEITMPDITTGESITVPIHTEEDVTFNPFAMHQTVTTSTPDGEEETLESYWTEEGFYQEDPMEGWVKLPSELSEGLDELMAMTTAGDQVAQAEALGEDMVVEDTGDAYQLSYEGDGEALMEAVLASFESMMGEEDASMSMEGIMEEINFNDISYEMTVEKETFYMTEMSMYIDMEIASEGESLNMVQSMDMSISNFNGVEPITVPEDVLNGAVPLEGIGEEGGELPDTASNDPLFAFAGMGLAALGAGMLLFRRRSLAQ